MRREDLGVVFKWERAFISLENSQKWWEEADISVFLEELQQEIELRIPEKFLEAKGGEFTFSF